METRKVERKPQNEIQVYFDYSKAQHKALKNKFGKEYHGSFQKIAKAMI